MVRTTRSSSGKGKEPPAKKAVVKKAAPSKKAKATSPKPKKASPKKSSSAKVAAGKSQKIVSIEACKQWGAFKTRANKIAAAVGDSAKVVINEEKVRAQYIYMVYNIYCLWYRTSMIHEHSF